MQLKRFIVITLLLVLSSAGIVLGVDLGVEASPASQATHSPTPDLDATVQARVDQALTATAQVVAQTPTPDIQATINAGIDAGVESALTATADSWTPTPTAYISPTPTRIPPQTIQDDDAFLGAEDGSVIIVEFSDFQCGYCARWYRDTLPQILNAYPDDVKFIYRDFTIFGEDSVRAAMSTECAEEQGMFWDMHNVLFDNLLSDEPFDLSAESLVDAAEGLGMDRVAFETCLIEERYIGEVIGDYQDAVAYGFGGTPGFVINGVVHAIGAQSFEFFDSLIRAELELGPQDEAPAAGNMDTDPSANNWEEQMPGQLTYRANPALNASLTYETTNINEFATFSGLDVAEDSTTPLLDLLIAVHNDLLAQTSEIGLTVTLGNVQEAQAITIGGVDVVETRVTIEPQLDSSGQVFPGLDLAIVLVPAPDEEQMTLVQYAAQGAVEPAAYADFRAWLEVNVPLLAQ